MSSPKPTGPSSPKATPATPATVGSPKPTPASPVLASAEASSSNPKSPKSPKSSTSAPQSPKTPKATAAAAAAAASPRSPSGADLPTTENFLPATHWTEAPLPDDDADSTLGSDAASSTASITSSVLAYRTVNGRTYHAERGNAGYWAANDESQSEAQDIVAHMSRLSLGGALYKSPVDTSKDLRVIDIGTGTGIWAMDFADEFPNCEVIGTDVSPIQPSWVPPNLKFEIEDCTQTWTFPDNSFDFVHIRMLYGSIPDWKLLFDEAYRVLKPGGWLESHEASPNIISDDKTVPKGSATEQWGKFYFETGERLGRTFKIIEEDIQIENFERLGLQNRGVFDYKSPLGAWPKDPVLNEIGRFGQAALQDAEGWVSYPANFVQGWTAADVGVFCAHLRAETRNNDIHGYFKQRVVWGQKPE